MSEAQPSGYKIQEQKIENGVLKMTVEVDRAVVSAAFKKVQKTISARVPVPGFRANKAPLALVLNVVGRETFLDELRREMLPAYVYRAIKELKVQPICEADIVIKTLASDQPFVFEASVAVSTPIDLGEYEAFGVERSVPATPSAELIEAQLAAYARENAKAEAVTEGGVQNGHLLLVNVDVEIDGVEYQTLARKNATLEIGQDQYLPGFDQHLLGFHKGDEVGFQMTLQGDEVAEHLRGKEAKFKVQLKVVRHVIVPEINDDLAKDAGFADLEAFKARIAAGLAHSAQHGAEKQAVDSLKKALIDRVTVDVPEVALAKRVAVHMASTKERLAKNKIDWKTWLKESGRTAADLENEARCDATKELKLDIALDSVAEREGIEATDADLEARVDAMAKALAKKKEDVFDWLDENGSRLVFQRDIAREQALDRLKERLLGLTEEDEHDHS
ncbi:MAG: trigger factor [Candidatus Riflebacteria bacterium]|nr:trigger factor [Candidatus Riflebacteria bacterium]